MNFIKDIGTRRGDRDCLYPHSAEETMKHWLIKAMIFKILHDLGRNVRTEAQSEETNGNIVDVLDEDNLVAYEVETVLTRKIIEQKLRNLWQLHDVFIIDTRKIPDGIEAAVEYLKRKIV